MSGNAEVLLHGLSMEDEFEKMLLSFDPGIVGRAPVVAHYMIGRIRRIE